MTRPWSTGVYVTLDLALEKRDTGEILWKRKRLRHSEEYQVSNDIMVTESQIKKLPWRKWQKTWQSG